MNESSRELHDELERATRRGAGADNELTKEAAELREGWLAFGQLLDAADRQFDPQALLARLSLTDGDAAAAPNKATQSTGNQPQLTLLPARRSWLVGALVGAAAASLLIGIGWSVWQAVDGSSGSTPHTPVARPDHSRDDDQPSVAVTNSQAAPEDLPFNGMGPSENATNDANELARTDTSAVADPSAWDDSFDQQLQLTQVRLWQARATTTGSEARLQTLRQAVDSFDSELNSSSL